MATAPLALIDAGVERLFLEAATAAPSVHNSQPWQFVVTARRIEVYADVTRQLRFADPTGRSVLISCGAALFNLRVAADHLDFHPRVRLDPADVRRLVGRLRDADREERAEPAFAEERLPGSGAAGMGTAYLLPHSARVQLTRGPLP